VNIKARGESGGQVGGQGLGEYAAPVQIQEGGYPEIRPSSNAELNQLPVLQNPMLNAYNQQYLASSYPYNARQQAMPPQHPYAQYPGVRIPQNQGNLVGEVRLNKIPLGTKEIVMKFYG
jgi:hypothetical protein